jgi:imidazolonepropionase-like amidohydrolase
MILGLDFSPLRFWTEEDGTLFGMVDPWYSSVAKGWESAIEPLVKVQQEMEAERDRELASKLGRPIPAAGLAVTNARVLDVKRGKWLDEHTVLIAGGKITAVGPSKKLELPEGAEVLDAAGKALLPGLWDMHTHLFGTDGVLYIASGVTTVRDLGNDPDRVDDYKKRFDEKSAIGPRVLRSGFIEGRGEKAAGSKVTAETEAEAKAAVDFYHQRGYEGIKIYNSMKPELVPVLARYAHEKGMRVSGHVPMSMLAEDAVKAGYDEIQHINMVFLNFVGDRTIDTRTPLRFSVVADKGADLDLKSKKVQRFIKLLERKKVAVDPTLGAFEDLFLARPGKPLPQVEGVRVRLPAQVQRYFKTEGLPVPEGKDEQYQKSYQRMLDMVKLLHSKGVPIVPGTDSLAAGLMLHYELGLYARAGISNAAVLRIATIGSARLMKRDRTSGSIDVGKDADLILVNGDPLAQIEDTKKVVSTIRGDVIYPSAELYKSVGVRPLDQ